MRWSSNQNVCICWIFSVTWNTAKRTTASQSFVACGKCIVTRQVCSEPTTDSICITVMHTSHVWRPISHSLEVIVGTRVAASWAEQVVAMLLLLLLLLPPPSPHDDEDAILARPLTSSVLGTMSEINFTWVDFNRRETLLASVWCTMLMHMYLIVGGPYCRLLSAMFENLILHLCIYASMYTTTTQPCL